MPEEKEDVGFKVTDRRHFYPDGTPRENVPEPEPVKVPTEAGLPSSGTTHRSREAEAESASGSAFGHTAGLLGEMTDMTPFMAALMEIATPAFIHLGMAEHPATGRPQINLSAAQHSIDLLGVLREKTKGNLTREEDNFFDDLLTDLRMQFVSLRR